MDKIKLLSIGNYLVFLYLLFAHVFRYFYANTFVDSLFPDLSIVSTFILPVILIITFLSLLDFKNLTKNIKVVLILNILILLALSAVVGIMFWAIYNL